MVRMPDSPAHKVRLREGLPRAWRGWRDSPFMGGRAWPGALRPWDLRQRLYSLGPVFSCAKEAHILFSRGLACGVITRSDGLRRIEELSSDKIPVPDGISRNGRTWAQHPDS